VSALSTLETRLHRGRYVDGTLDLLVGLAVLTVALDLYLGEAYGLVVLAAISPLAWRGVRRRLVEPRLGFVRFTAERRERQTSALRRLLLGLVAACIAGVACFFVLRGLEAPSEVRLPFGLGLAALIIGVGVGLDQRRLFAYGALLAASFAAAIPMGGRDELPQTVAVAGVIITICALWRLGTFLARNPLREAHDDGQA
jgi:hypothetical protein